MNETLHCQPGQHSWTRESKRGRKPTACPEHSVPVAPATKIKVATETLHCQAGHEWTRTPTRGRKPQWCPDHKPTVEPSKTKAHTTSDTTRAIIREELNRSRMERCSCEITEDMTFAQLIELGAGCTAGHHVCMTLDAIRRRYPGR